MATRKNAQKTTERAKSNLSLDNVKISKKTQKSVEKTLKSTSGKVFLVAFVFLLIGILLGGGAFWFVCRNDCFSLVGNDELTLTLDENYVEDGVKIVAFGIDEKDSISVETNLTVVADGTYGASEVGTYYIKYKSSCFKFGTLFKVEKVRLITFVEASEGGE